jgi:hypothetical protein
MIINRVTLQAAPRSDELRAEPILAERRLCITLARSVDFGHGKEGAF